MSFINLSAFYWFIPVFILFLFLAVHAGIQRKKRLKLLLGASSLDPDAVKLSSPKRFLRNLFFLIGLTALLVAAARPFWSSQLIPYEAHGRDLMVLFDVSKSMLAADLAPSRLEHARFLLRQLAAKNAGDRLGLVAFAGSAYLTCPLTSDPMAFDQYVDELTPDLIPVGGTNLELALATAEKAFQAAGGSNRAIVLLTDGDELTGDSSRVLSSLKKTNIPLLVIGLGSPENGAPIPDGQGGLRRNANGQLITSRLNEAKLRQLALESGGVYVRSTVLDSGLNVIENRIRMLGREEQSAGKRTIPIEKFPIFLIIAAIALFLYLLISERPGTGWKTSFSGKKFSLWMLAAICLLGTSEGMGEDTSAPEAAVSAALPSDGLRKNGSEPGTAGAAAVPAETPKLPENPAELYNLARTMQQEGKPGSETLYEEVIRKAAKRPLLAAASFQNLGVGEHVKVRQEYLEAEQQVRNQALDSALQKLTAAFQKASGARELYARSISIPEAEAAGVSQNLQQLSEDEKRIEELKKKIEELKKKQQQAQQKTQQAQQKQQQQQKQDQQKQDQQKQDQQKQDQQKQDQQKQDQQKQDQQKQDQQKQDQQKQDQQKQDQQKQDQQKQDQQKQDQQKQDQQKQDQQKQDQQKRDSRSEVSSAINQAEQSAKELKDQARELQQKKLEQQAQTAEQELKKAQAATEQKRDKEAGEHLEKARKALGDASSGKENKPESEKEKKSDQNQQKADQRKNNEKKPGQGKPMPQGAEEKKDGKMDQKTAEALLQMMAGEEKNLRDQIKQDRRSRIRPVEKDW